MKNIFYKILLIEDSSYDALIVQKLLAKQLGHSKFAVTHVPLYKMAMETIKTNSYDFILSDLSLPDGYHAYKNVKIIKQYSKDTPIAVMSGFVDIHLKKKLLNLGVIEYFDKADLINQNLGSFLERSIKAYKEEQEKN